jgi:hypothetical protein
MNWMASSYLRAKSWEIFLLLFGAMTVSEIPLITSHPSATEQNLTLFWILTLAFMLCFLGWFWALGSFLNSIVRPELRPGKGFFRFSLFYPALYLAVFMAFFPPSAAVLAVIFPFHLLAVFCMFYLLRFVARNLALAETGKKVTFYDYAGPFFLLWFFPIGVWLVQPRINRLYAVAGLGEGPDGGAPS